MKLLAFGVVSGTGWLIDVALFALLLVAGCSPLTANTLSASVAVTFVYFASTRKVFHYQGHFLLAKFALYLAYQGLSILAFSGLIYWLVGQLGLPPLAAKVLVTPATFYSNFLFMHLLTCHTVRLY